MEHTLSGTDKEEWFTQIYEKYVEDIYRLCFSFMKNQADTEDVVQETFLKLYHCKTQFETMEHIKAWLVVTASNHCKNILKHWWRKGKNIQDYAEMLGAEETPSDEMLELVMQLPDKYKTAVYLYYYEGYDSKQIARILHKPDSTIRTYLQNARKLLKEKWME